MDRDASNDLMEYIYKEDDVIITKIFTKSQLAEAEILLKSLTADIRLDLHNVLDLFDHEYNFIVHKSICCISFVGKFSKLRQFAKNDVKKRILSGQVDFGILVFARGRNKNKNKFTDIGSKAWVNNHLKYGGKALFIDDGYDHIKSTDSLGNKDIETFWLDEKSISKVIIKVEDF